MAFWITAAGLALVVAWGVARALWRAPEALSGPGQDIRIYRDQLAEVDRDLVRRVLGPEDAERARLEISRRMLEADRAAAAEAGRARPAGGVGPVSFGVVALVLLAAFWLYATLGAPGYPDLPSSARIAAAEDLRAARPSQSEAEAEAMAARAGQAPPQAADPAFQELVGQLREAVAGRPGDLRGQELLAQNEMALGNYPAAVAAQRRVIEIKAGAASGADHAALADLMILAAGGLVTAEAEAVLDETLRQEPQNGTARFYLGLMHAQTGRPDLAFAFWRALLEEGPDQAPWMPVIRASIGPLAAAAGVDYAAPEATALAGPEAGDVAAAAEMSDEDRAAMIRGMVGGLEERLLRDGGSVGEWLQLFGALAVLGEADRAGAAWLVAQEALAGDAAALAQVRDAALAAGVEE